MGDVFMSSLKIIYIRNCILKINQFYGALESLDDSFYAF